MNRQLVACLLVIGVSDIALSQTITGVVRESTTRAPVPGAVVVALDSTRREVVRTLSDPAGRYRVVALTPVSHLRFMKIGFRPYETNVDFRSAGLHVEYDATLDLLSSVLPSVRVLADSRCPARAETQDAYALWEQARIGLLATIVAGASRPAQVVLAKYTQNLDEAGSKIVRNTAQLDSVAESLGTFAAVRSVGAFLHAGYTVDSAGHRIFLGPDATTLLDTAFLAGYCLSFVRHRADTGIVGVAFSPATRRKGIVDITGTLWLNRSPVALHELEFRYIGLERGAERFQPGGIVRFTTAGNGLSFISRWQFRLVGATEDTLVDNDHAFVRQWPFLSLVGGEVARVVWADRTKWSQRLGTLRARVVQRDGRPATGRKVVLDDTNYWSVTDGFGVAMLSDLVPGPYTVRVWDERLAKLGISIPTNVTFEAVRDSTLQRDVRAATAEEFVVDRCVADKRWTYGDSTLVLGVVVRADGARVKRASVDMDVLSTPGDPSPARRTYHTGSDGLFQLCGSPLAPGKDIRATARAGTSSGSITVRLASGLTLVKLIVKE